MSPPGVPTQAPGSHRPGAQKGLPPDRPCSSFHQQPGPSPTTQMERGCRPPLRGLVEGPLCCPPGKLRALLCPSSPGAARSVSPSRATVPEAPPSWLRPSLDALPPGAEAELQGVGLPLPLACSPSFPFISEISPASPSSSLLFPLHYIFLTSPGIKKQFSCAT